MTEFPKREFFFKPVLQAIQELGSSGSNEEINNKVIEMLKIPDELLLIMHKNTNQTVFEYEMAWVRTMLKNQGVLLNPQRGIWTINTDGDYSTINLSFSKYQEKEVSKEVNDDEDWR